MTADIEVAYDRGRRRWVVRPFGGDGVFTFANFRRKTDAVMCGNALGRVLKCEVYTRRKDGTLGERNTYRHDPERFEG